MVQPGAGEEGSISHRANKPHNYTPYIVGIYWVYHLLKGSLHYHPKGTSIFPMNKQLGYLNSRPFFN